MDYFSDLSFPEDSECSCSTVDDLVDRPISSYFYSSSECDCDSAGDEDDDGGGVIRQPDPVDDFHVNFIDPTVVLDDYQCDLEENSLVPWSGQFIDSLYGLYGPNGTRNPEGRLYTQAEIGDPHILAFLSPDMSTGKLIPDSETSPLFRAQREQPPLFASPIDVITWDAYIPGNTQPIYEIVVAYQVPDGDGGNVAMFWQMWNTPTGTLGPWPILIENPTLKPVVAGPFGRLEDYGIPQRWPGFAFERFTLPNNGPNGATDTTLQYFRIRNQDPTQPLSDGPVNLVRFSTRPSGNFIRFQGINFMKQPCIEQQDLDIPDQGDERGDGIEEECSRFANVAARFQCPEFNAGPEGLFSTPEQNFFSDPTDSESFGIRLAGRFDIIEDRFSFKRSYPYYARSEVPVAEHVFIPTIRFREDLSAVSGQIQLTVVATYGTQTVQQNTTLNDTNDLSFVFRYEGTIYQPNEAHPVNNYQEVTFEVVLPVPRPDDQIAVEYRPSLTWMNCRWRGNGIEVGQDSATQVGTNYDFALPGQRLDDPPQVGRVRPQEANSPFYFTNPSITGVSGVVNARNSCSTVAVYGDIQVFETSGRAYNISGAPSSLVSVRTGSLRCRKHTPTAESPTISGFGYCFFALNVINGDSL